MTYNQICEYVFSQEGIKLNESHKSRKVEFVEARFICFALGKEFTKLSLEKLGNQFNKDHATALHGLHKVKDWCQTDKNFKRKYDYYYNCICENERAFGILLQNNFAEL